MTGWPDRRFAALLGSPLPIVAAPMAGVAGVELAVAALLGGAVGSLPCAMLTPAAAEAQIAEVRARAPGPLNLNFFCHHPPAPVDETEWRALLAPFYAERGLDQAPPAAPSRQPFGPEMCALVERVQPEIVSFHFGLPDPDLLDRVRATGARVLGNASTVAEARWLAAHGVDAIIAQGWEAGGHVGRFLDDPPEFQLGLFALVPQIADATGLPVIAAGGIGDARGMAAALMLGAAAVQLGTAYLHCPECLIEASHRADLVGPAAERTRFTNLYSGGLARGLPTALTEKLGPIRAEAPPFPLAGSAVAPLGLRPHWAGQAAPLGRPEAARALTERLGRETLALLDARG